MDWKCKLCSVSLDTRAKLFRHYQLHHNHFSRVSPLPCLYSDCICTFQSFNAVKAHLSRYHSDTGRINLTDGSQSGSAFFTCPLCGTKQTFSEASLFSHLRDHLRNHEVVVCPYSNCSYSTNAYSSFNAHKSRNHAGSSDFDTNIVCSEKNGTPDTPAGENVEEGPAQCESTDPVEVESQCDTDTLRAQLHKSLASLFLKMKTILHVSDLATQDIVENLTQIFSLSQPLVKQSLREVLEHHDISISENTLDDIVTTVLESNILVNATAKGRELSSTKRRKTFVEKNYPVVKPVEYMLDPGHTAVYVPILDMIQKMFKHTDILDKILETKMSEEGHFMSHQDGSYYKENELFSSSDDLKLPLILYIDDLEIANPLGTSRKIHKLCSVYWVFADLPSKYRSSLHVLQLAALCKVSDVQRVGYERLFGPLLRDIQTLEQDGVFIESIGKAVKGTVLCVVADNLAAHALAGFTKCFRAQYMCRFCTATKDQIQAHDVGSGEFSVRTKASHDVDVDAALHGVSQSGVQGVCVLRQGLQYFHTVTGFPPDVLHDLLEGIVPVELALCIGKMIHHKYFTLEYLNRKIVSFPYKHTDKVDRPQPVPKTFTVKKTIGGNGHENATLLRLLPLIIGSKVPEEDGAWSVLMDLKEIVELMICPVFTDESIQYLQMKIQDHRHMLQEVFPDFTLRPKHHYTEHYADLIRCFGPLVHLWTMRFEGKHRFFKRVVHDTLNFKNVLKTLANRHQHMMAYSLSAPSFFKPHQQTSSVSSVMVSGLPDVAKAYIEHMTDSSMVYSTSVVNVDGTDYGVEMFVSVGQEGGLPQFSKIEQILLVDNQIVFLCKTHTSYYIEHLRSYELSPGNLTVHLLKELNDTLPLSAYRTDGRLLLTTKRTSTHQDMAAPQKFVLRVCVETDVAMKLILAERPQSVEELKNIMQEKFKPRLDCDFTLQYEDPDFDGQLSVLMDIQELPEKGTLKVVRSESDVSSIGSSDTDILPHVPLRQRQKNWPDCFPVPTFSYEVEHVCAQGNAVFENSGKTLKLTRAQKHNILENMAETMYNFKPYPHDKEVGMAAEALVAAHPCLREHGSKNGWYGWKVALKFKMGNFRTKLARSGCAEVSINAGKRSRTNPENDHPHSNIKRARRAEVNFLPNFPRGENEATLEEMRVQIIQETEKTERDQILIEKLMHTTFALRRQHIVQGSPRVREFLENWPALRMQSQVFAEFHRITNVNLRNQFYCELDRYTPKLVALYRQKSSRTGKGAEALRQMLRIYDLEEEHDINMRRTLALRALPVYLREDDTEFYKTCNGEDEMETTDTPLALLSVVPDSTGSISFSPENISIVIEDEVVMSELPRLADAFVVLLGLIYALHLDYPKKLAHTFTFIQKVLMCLDDNKPLKPCLLSLKNDLLKE